jgi:membrane-associated PAP2 superfamily phosphatase
MAHDFRTPADRRRFWLTHAGWPAAAFLAASVLIATLDLDRRITHAWYYDLVHGTWLGEGSGAWWARDLLHSAGRWLVRLVALAALIAWLVTRFRRRAAFALLAILLATGIVGGLKAVTNVDCPWDLEEFNGDRPYIGLFADRPAGLPHARCFPGAHASSGFAMMFGYFLLRDSSRRWARRALAGGLLVGLLFSLGQEARGAHFVSHDLTSAAVVWFVQLVLYRAMLVPASPSTE